MQIIWKGQSCFQIITSPVRKFSISNGANQGKNNTVNIVIDPFDETIGLRVPVLEADVLLITHSHSDHNNLKAVKGNPFIINGPGEYEVKEVFVQGILAFHDNVQGKEKGRVTIYTIEAEDLRLCHLSDLGQKELSSEQIEKIGPVDILMIPVGGFFTIDGKEALKIMSQIEPKITIPMHYQLPKLKIKIEGIDKFLKTLGAKKIEPLSKLTIKKKDISEEEAKIVVLKP